MTLYKSDMSDLYIDDDGVSAFTDDNGETVIIADDAPVEPRVFTCYFVVALIARQAMILSVFVNSDGTARSANTDGVMVNL
jgi:hypothetical protein